MDWANRPRGGRLRPQDAVCVWAEEVAMGEWSLLCLALGGRGQQIVDQERALRSRGKEANRTANMPAVGQIVRQSPIPIQL